MQGCAVALVGAALVAGELRDVPVVLDLDDLDVALAPREQWSTDPSKADLSRPGSAVYISLLTRATGAAAAITVETRAISISVSQSSGTVRVFKDGEPVLELQQVARRS